MRSSPAVHIIENPFRHRAAWLLSLALCAALVLACIAWVDRPVATWVHANTHGNAVLIWLSRIPEPLYVLAWPVLVLAGGAAVWRRRLDDWIGTLALCAASIVLSTWVKNGLKMLAGRTWPETWTNGNPSFIADGVFGFHWLAGADRAYASFPSGHLATIVTCCAVLWLRYPRGRWVYALAVALTALGQLGSNYHWCSDVLAGSYVGTVVACVVIAVASLVASRFTARSRPGN